MPSHLSFPQAAVYTPQILPDDPNEPFAVLTQDRTDEHLLQQYAARFPELLIVQEIWKDILPQTAILISSAICGGDIRERFFTAAQERPCWLLIEKVQHRFPLPCPDAMGTIIDISAQSDGFYSRALCCRYTHTLTPTESFMVLWDTEDTLREKMQLAKDVGFLGYVLPCT